MAKGISFAITADERAALMAVGRLNRRLLETQSTAERFGRGASQAFAATGLPRLTAGVTELGRRFHGAADGVGRFLPALGIITGAATLGGIVRLAQTWANFGTRLGLDAQRIQTSARGLQGLQGAATLAGSSAEALTDGMRTLGDNLVDAVGGRSPETVQMLSTLGIAFRDSATGGARLATDVLPEIADKIAAIKNPSLQARAAVALFGGAGEALLPFLRRGAAGIAEYNAVALRYGAINEQGVEQANRLREAQAKLGLAAEGVGYTIAERVSPVLVPLLNRLADWIAAHREEIGQFFENVAKRIERWVDSGGIESLIGTLENFGSRVSTLAENFGGATTVIEAFFALWLGSKALGAIAAITSAVTGLRALGLLANPFGAGAAVLGAGGAAAGAMNMPMLDEYGRQVGNWGGAEGERNVQRQRFYNSKEERDSGSLRRTGPPPPTSAEQTNLAAQARDFFLSKGWSPAAAAGLVANIQKESNFDPNAVGDNGQAYGLAQWHGDRRGALDQLTGRRMVGSSFMQQLDAIDAELTRGGERRAGDALRAARTSGEAGAIVSRLYERPAARDAEAAQRAGMAEQWTQRWGARPSAPNGVPRVGPIFGPQAPAGAAPVAPAPPPVAAAGAAGVNGTATVRLEHVNPPADTRLTMQTTGDLVFGGVRIMRPTLGNVP